ncbi:hypothetical protein [Rhizobium gallicum]|uniref:hypothetical protein n=1 Tax=Rhizobium gallicum TaxID=56730 RepID=UPI001EF8E070|nr:hypothetical protein [Rhizobium gallicum]ULJ74622.1 hypothetical protein L2W42_30130 [Rhizobium gallicum]
MSLTIPVQDPGPATTKIVVSGPCRDLHGTARASFPLPEGLPERIQAYNSPYWALFGNRLGGRILIRPEPFVNASGAILSYFEEEMNVMHIHSLSWSVAVGNAAILKTRRHSKT